MIYFTSPCISTFYTLHSCQHNCLFPFLFQLFPSVLLLLFSPPFSLNSTPLLFDYLIPFVFSSLSLHFPLPSFTNSSCPLLFLSSPYPFCFLPRSPLASLLLLLSNVSAIYFLAPSVLFFSILFPLSFFFCLS